VTVTDGEGSQLTVIDPQNGKGTKIDIGYGCQETVPVD